MSNLSHAGSEVVDVNRQQQRAGDCVAAQRAVDVGGTPPKSTGKPVRMQKGYSCLGGSELFLNMPNVPAIMAIADAAMRKVKNTHSLQHVTP